MVKDLVFHESKQQLYYFILYSWFVTQWELILIASGEHLSLMYLGIKLLDKPIKADTLELPLLNSHLI